MKRFIKQTMLGVSLAIFSEISVWGYQPFCYSTKPIVQTAQKEIPNPERMARREADRMKNELTLSDKQYKKVYKLILQEQKDRVKNISQQGMPPMPMGNRPSDMPPMGNPPSMNGDFPQGNRPNFGRGDMSQRDANKNKKMKKILTEEQYNKWRNQMKNNAGQHPRQMGKSSDYKSEKGN